MEYPKVCVIMLSYNRKEDTIECIESLRKMTYPHYKILVVENGSSDGSGQAVKDHYPDVELIELKNNVGYAKGFNEGLEYSYNEGADYFLILNNDIVVDPEMLTELVRTAQENEEIGFVSGKVYYYDDPKRIQTVGKQSHAVFLVGDTVGYGEYDEGQYDEKKEYDFIDDVFLLVRREVYERVGGYDENFFFHWEETDWCSRVRRAGYKIVYTPAAKIWHKGLLTTANGMSPTALFYITRNQFLFIRRNAEALQFRKTLLHLFFREYPLNTARFMKHGKFSYVRAYWRGILSGIFCLMFKQQIRKKSFY